VAAKGILFGDHRYWRSVVVPQARIVSGKVGGLYSGESTNLVRDRAVDLCEAVCKGHEVKIVVLDEDGSTTLFSCRKDVGGDCILIENGLGPDLNEPTAAEAQHHEAPNSCAPSTGSTAPASQIPSSSDHTELDA